MRIGIEAQRIFRKKKHGMDIVALELIKHLQVIDTQNEYVIFVKDDEDNLVIGETINFKIVKVKSSPYPLWEQYYLPKAVKDHKVDLLHCTSNTAPLFLSVPLVLTLHDIIYLEKLDFSQGTAYQKFGNLYRRYNVPAVVKKANKILTVSNYENNRIVSHFGLNQEQVVTAYNGVGSHFSRVTDQAVLDQTKQRYALPDKFVFFLGNTDPKKNVKGVLEAMLILLKANKLNFKLVMLDINKTYLENLARSIGGKEVLDHIQFTGYVPNKELPAIYSLASFFIYPSLRESFGIPLLEAMSCEVPVITSNTSSMPEIAGDGALYIDPFKPQTLADAINKLSSDADLQKHLVQQAKKQLPNFTWTKNAALTLDIYKQILINN